MVILSIDSRIGLLLGIALPVLLFIRAQFRPSITRNGEPLRKPPNTLPLLGNGILFLQPRQRLFAWFTECERRFGYETLGISVPSLPPGVIVSDPRNLDFVLNREDVFEKGDFFKDRARALFGHGIVNVDGEAWRVQRRAGLRFLGVAALRRLTGEELPRLLDEALGGLGNGSSEDGEKVVVDLQGVVLDVTTRLMGRMAYNMDLRAGDDFTRAFEHASGATAERFQNPLWFVTEWFTAPGLGRSLAVVKEYGRRIVMSAVADRAASKPLSSSSSKSDAPGSLIQSLLDAMGDESLVADAALNYLSAGRDTVAQALTWTLYLLMRYPDVVLRLRESIVVAGRAAAEAEALTPAELPYALAVFYEALRLYPPIPFEIKQAQRATTLPDGTMLPEGAVVVWCAWAMNRSQRTWGDDAASFRPERWITEDKVVQRPAGEFPVFNGGPRTCLGKRMAELVAVQVLARVVAEFDIEPAFEGERVSRSSLTLPMEGGLPVYVRRRG